MTHWVDICDKADLQADSGVCALVEDKHIAIFYLEQEQKLFAIDNYDPFGKISVLSRGLIGDIQGQVMVSSPLYKHHFNLSTGQCFEDDSVSLCTYDVRINGDRVELNLKGAS